MKILALSDEVVPHLYNPAIRETFRDVGLVLGCGDVPFYYLEFVVSMLDVPLYYVHGNHDHTKQYMADGRVATSAEGCICVDGETASVDGIAADWDGLLLAGLGGSIRYRPGEHQYSENEMVWRAWKLAPHLWLNRLHYGRFLDILITHSPPRSIHDKPDPAHIGFRAFRAFMKRYRPRYLLHGHSHVYRKSAVTQTQFYDTQVVNVYPYRIIEL